MRGAQGFGQVKTKKENKHGGKKGFQETAQGQEDGIEENAHDTELVELGRRKSLVESGNSNLIAVEFAGSSGIRGEPTDVGYLGMPDCF
jgi:hypothetical protein